MEKAVLEKVTRLGFLLRKKEKIDAEIASLSVEVETALGGKTVQVRTTPAPVAAPARPQPVAALPKEKSAARVKQGEYMGLVKALSEGDKKIVQAVKESQGVDDAILVAKKLKSKTAKAKGQAVEPEAEDEPLPEFDGETSDTFEDIV